MCVCLVYIANALLHRRVHDLLYWKAFWYFRLGRSARWIETGANGAADLGCSNGVGAPPYLAPVTPSAPNQGQGCRALHDDVHEKGLQIFRVCGVLR